MIDGNDSLGFLWPTELDQAVRSTLQWSPGGVCARVPADTPDHVVIDVHSGRNGQGPARVHVRPGRVVGLERPEEQSLRPREAGR